MIKLVQRCVDSNWCRIVAVFLLSLLLALVRNLLSLVLGKCHGYHDLIALLQQIMSAEATRIGALIRKKALNNVLRIR